MPSPVSLPLEVANPANSAWNKPFLRIGHGGAAGHALPNSLASFSLALEMGVDVVEFDVRPCRDALVLMHDDSLARYNYPGMFASQCTLAELHALDIRPENLIVTLIEALDFLKGRALLNIDLKSGGYEKEVVEATSAKGMLGDVIFSSVIPSSLRKIRQYAPAALTGLSYPEDRAGASSKPYMKPIVEGVVAAMRLILPYQIISMMRDAQANAVMLYHKVVSPSVIQAVHKAGGKVFTWTVDDRARIGKLVNMSVNGIATNHPDLFTPT